MKRRVSGIVAGVALTAGFGAAVPATASALPESRGLPLAYEVPIGPEVAQVVHDTGVAHSVYDAGVLVPVPGWENIVIGHARVLAGVTDDIAGGLPCGAIGLRTDGDRWSVVGASYARC